MKNLHLVLKIGLIIMAIGLLPVVILAIFTALGLDEGSGLGLVFFLMLCSFISIPLIILGVFLDERKSKKKKK
tara:strand:- start:7 stop:225 length:219 start_codon:yes stop_codon:yes gene_type:complete